MADDDREALGRIAHDTYRAWLAEQVQRLRGDEMQLGPWEDLTEGLREAYMRIASAVAAQAVAGAKLHNERMEARLLALGAHRAAVFDALRAGLSAPELTNTQRGRYRAALKALGGEEET